VNAEFLRDHVGDLTRPIFYAAGPSGLVTAMARALHDASVVPDHVQSEEFEGY